jgi:hypothetical protein
MQPKPNRGLGRDPAAMSRDLVWVSSYDLGSRPDPQMGQATTKRESGCDSRGSRPDQALGQQTHSKSRSDPRQV